MGCNKSKSAGSIADSLAEDSRRRIVANAEKVLREEKAAAKKQKILNAMLIDSGVRGSAGLRED